MHRWTPGIARRALWAGTLLGLAGLALLAVTPTRGAPAPAPAAQTAPGESTPTGYDPLSPDEQAEALAALQAVGVQAAAAPLRQSAPDQAGELPVSAPAESVVLVERHQESKEAMQAGGWPRRADVYVYDYADNAMQHAVVNLDSGAVDATETLAGVQLNLTDAERRLAVEVAWADPELRAALVAAYQAHGGVTPAGPEDIDARVFTYVGGSAPDLEGPGGAACRVDRCAQLLVLTPDGATLEYLPLVNLTTLQVAAIMSPTLSQ